MGNTIIGIVIMIMFFLSFMDIYKIRRNTDEIVKQNKQIIELQRNTKNS
ncbi:hypothetical protein [Macrococcoides canis]|nr:hypothetical protein [Macrococcus canis]MCO4096127.1 hypothetical protein [Macrococcus canis]QTQ08164.1 hypothetical protein J9174_00310 [Macrococcus canis]UTH02504.1 hypothetical protein KFV05_00440 [Macrococcus canis]UTH09261.1 hypothetical protein KFV08_00275 [Macrococcus canis]UTH11624.1 hypothetical protein KFV10_00460 [Macrococcus canis]